MTSSKSTGSDHNVGLVPGPKGLPLLGSAINHLRDPLGFSTKCAHSYGDVVFFRVGPIRTYMFNHPSLIEEILRKQSESLIKSVDYRALQEVFGNGLLLSEGSFWKRHRRLMQPAFHHERIVAYSEVMTACTDRKLASWQDGETRDLHQEMMQLTLDIVARTLFGADVAKNTSEVENALNTIMVHYKSYAKQMQVVSVLPKWLPIPGQGRFREAVEQLNAIVYGIIRDRRQMPGEDLLSMLLQATDEDGSQLSDQELRDEVTTLLLAGHETTANALSWTLMLLSQHPEVEARLLQELQSVLGDRAPTVADLDQLFYLQRVIQESMRIYPPVWALSREVVRDCQIGEYRLPPGTLVYVSPWVMHRDSRFFEAPDQFRPERWADHLEQCLPPGAYFPFGDGPRVCIGQSFAMMEVKLLLAKIVQTFHFTLVSDYPIELLPSITLRPKWGIGMVLSQRKSET